MLQRVPHGPRGPTTLSDTSGGWQPRPDVGFQHSRRGSGIVIFTGTETQGRLVACAANALG
jgi:hypothetical protein